MTCHNCKTEAGKFGRFRNKNRIVQRYRCPHCLRTFSESQPLEGTRLESARVVQVVRMLAEGLGVRAISRLTGVNTGTIGNILEAVGNRCMEVMDERIRGLTVEHVEADELFGFVRCLQQNTFIEDPEAGAQFTFIASDRKTKLIIAHLTAKRSKENAIRFLSILRERIAGRFSLSTDAYAGYSFPSMYRVFGREINHGTETKFFAQETEGPRRFNPKKVLWVKRRVQIGEMEYPEICTSRAERLNLSFRLFNKRLARKTLGYSKTIEALRQSVALTVAHFNFCRVHSSLDKQTPAMAAHLTDHVWSVAELLGVMGERLRVAA